MDLKAKRLLINWYAWIMQDMLATKNSDTFFEYVEFMDWMQVSLDYNDLDHESIIEFSSKEQLSFWFEFDRSFDKQSLMDMQPDKQYEIKKRYNGYTMVEICNSSK